MPTPSARSASTGARRCGRRAASTTASDRDRLPLFEAAGHADLRREPDVDLPPMPLGEHVVNDYRFLKLSLKAHPVSLPAPGARRAPRGRHRDVAGDAATDGVVTVAGLVLVRQRPGTAKGVIFMTLEDETAIANAIVWPKVFERFRPIVIGARLVAVTGKLQSESGVIHVVADRARRPDADAGRRCRRMPATSSLARSDEVRRPGVDNRDKVDMRHPRLVRFFQEHPSLATDLARLSAAAGKVMPRGRNFH